MVQWMGVINLTPDSFYEPSRVNPADVPAVLARIRGMVSAGASVIDLGAVSTRPGAAPVPTEEEWARLEPVLRALGAGEMAGQTGDGAGLSRLRISVDTTSSEIVRRASRLVKDLIVNDISAGEDDPLMLPAVAKLGLTYVAMHKRGTPLTMDSQTDYQGDVMRELVQYFRAFARMAETLGIRDWILDPGLGFAKTDAQNWEILRRLDLLGAFGRPILIGAADKRFTRSVPRAVQRWFDRSGVRVARQGLLMASSADAPGAPSGTDIAHALAVAHGASILRVHDIPE